MNPRLCLRSPSLSAWVLAFNLLLIFFPLGGALYIRENRHFEVLRRGLEVGEVARYLGDRSGTSGDIPRLFPWQRVIGPQGDSGWIAGEIYNCMASGWGGAISLPEEWFDLDSPPKLDPFWIETVLRETGPAKGLSPDGRVIFFLTKDFGDGSLLFLADKMDLRLSVRALRRLWLLIFGVSLAAAGLLSFLFVRIVRRPLVSLAGRVAVFEGDPRIGGMGVDDFPREIRPLAAAFEQAAVSLDERTRENEEFTSDILHELKNPLAAVRARLEILASGDASSCAQALSEVGRIEGLLYGIRELGRYESQSFKGEFYPLSLVSGLRALYGESPVVWHVGPGLEGQRCSLDSDAAGRVVRNLVDNGLDYSPEWVGVRFSVRGECLLLDVADRGPGVPLELRERIFDRFYSHRRGNGDHSGLGLAIVRTICRSVGGRAECMENPDGGALFRVEIPFVEE